MQNYFQNFPVITYQNYQAINILDRVAIADNLKKDIANYFLYPIVNGTRPDIVADQIYGIDEYDWVIFLMNNIIDPYYDWPLSQENLEATITYKYGSLSYASLKILYWQNNWYANNIQFTTGEYDNLDPSLKQYWSPTIQRGNIVSSYSRKRSNTQVVTNQTGTIIFNSLAANTFNTGDLIAYSNNSNNSANYAEVTWANSSAISIKNIIGFTEGNVQITDLISNVSANGVFTLNSGGIPSQAIPYFTPISIYQDALNDNQEKSLIILLKPEYIGQAVTLISNALQQVAMS